MIYIVSACSGRELHGPERELAFHEELNLRSESQTRSQLRGVEIVLCLLIGTSNLNIMKGKNTTAPQCVRDLW